MEIILGVFLITIVAGIFIWKWLVSIDYTIGEFVDYSDLNKDVDTPPWVEESHTETGFN
jgi:hypothetical protein